MQNKHNPISLEFGDISSWSMEFSKEEISTTTLCNVVKKYRASTKYYSRVSIKNIFNKMFLKPQSSLLFGKKSKSYGNYTVTFDAEL